MQEFKLEAPENLQYHNDGQISYAKDNSDPVMDRAYNYDQAGRVAEGLSGSEARGLTTQDGIYRQSYQYDVWDNLTGRAVNRFWSGGEPFNTAYVNNREQGAVYDGDGRATWDSGRSHIYDAAGRQVQTREQSQSSSWGVGMGASQSTSPPTSPSTSIDDGTVQPNMPIGGYYTTTTLTLAESYDGDGRSLKRVETKTQSTPYYQPVTTERVDYYVRSSVPRRRCGGGAATVRRLSKQKD